MRGDIIPEKLTWVLVIVDIEVWGYSLQKNQDQVSVCLSVCLFFGIYLPVTNLPKTLPSPSVMNQESGSFRLSVLRQGLLCSLG